MKFILAILLFITILSFSFPLKLTKTNEEFPEQLVKFHWENADHKGHTFDQNNTTNKVTFCGAEFVKEGKCTRLFKLVEVQDKLITFTTKEGTKLSLRDYQKEKKNQNELDFKRTDASNNPAGGSEGSTVGPKIGPIGASEGSTVGGKIGSIGATERISGELPSKIVLTIKNVDNRRKYKAFQNELSKILDSQTNSVDKINELETLFKGKDDLSKNFRGDIETKEKLIAFLTKSNAKPQAAQLASYLSTKYFITIGELTTLASSSK